jgi:hypothetical protein
MNSGTETEHTPTKYIEKVKEILKMKNIENMNVLNDMVMAKVAGGVIWPDYHRYSPPEPEEPEEGGAEGTW